MEERDAYIDIKVLFNVIIQKLWLIILTAIVFAAGSFAYTTYLVTPMYRSTTTLYVINTEDFQSTISSSDLAAAQSLAASYVKILCSNTTLTNVSKAVNGAYSATQLAGMVSTGTVTDTEILQISVTCPSKTDAKLLADLVSQEGTKEIVRIIKVGSISVVDPATDAVKASPNVRKNTLIGFLAGVVLILAILVVKEIFDTKIKSAEQLFEIYGIEIIGIIPQIEGGRDIE